VATADVRAPHLREDLEAAAAGEARGELSARVGVFIWSYIKRLFSARHSSGQKEHLGYVAGGYKTVLGRLEEVIGPPAATSARASR